MENSANFLREVALSFCVNEHKMVIASKFSRPFPVFYVFGHGECVHDGRFPASSSSSTKWKMKTSAGV